MTHEYTEGGSILEVIPETFHNSGVPLNYSHFFIDLSVFSRNLITSSKLVSGNDGHPTVFPRPEVEIFTAFQAITTYPPIYKQFDTSSTSFTLVVPRVYPPIYVKPTGRNRR